MILFPKLKWLVDEVTGQRVQIPGLEPTPINVYLTLITSMFMHGGLAHILGNMLFLYIFGDNLEDAMGHGRYFFFYLLCGIIAGLSHVFATYFFGTKCLCSKPWCFWCYFRSNGRLHCSISTTQGSHMDLLFLYNMRFRHFIAVGLWFVFQVVNGLGALGGDEAAGGIAYAAHIGGFIAGLILVKMFDRRRPVLVQERKAFW